MLRQRKLRQGRCTVTDSSAAFSGKCGGAPCWMRIYRIKPYLRNIDGIGKEIVDLHLDSDQHQNVITSRGSSLAHTYHVWWTRSQGILLTEWQTDSNNHMTPPWQSDNTGSWQYKSQMTEWLQRTYEWYRKLKGTAISTSLQWMQCWGNGTSNAQNKELLIKWMKWTEWHVTVKLPNTLTTNWSKHVHMSISIHIQRGL